MLLELRRSSARSASAIALRRPLPVCLLISRLERKSSYLMILELGRKALTKATVTAYYR